MSHDTAALTLAKRADNTKCIVNSVEHRRVEQKIEHPLFSWNHGSLMMEQARLRIAGW
jgi:hypothetical protein